MNRYTLTKKLGDGTYGSVLKAVNRQTGEEVAVKKMKKMFTRCVRKLALSIALNFAVEAFNAAVLRHAGVGTGGVLSGFDLLNCSFVSAFLWGRTGGDLLATTTTKS